VLRANLKWKLVARLVGSCLAIVLAIGMTSCEQSSATMPTVAANLPKHPLATTDGPLAEVNIPESISNLAPSLEKFQPQVRILSPQPDQILTDDSIAVKLQVSDLPIFKSPELGLGNHLHVILDKQIYQGVFDLTQPLVFKNLAAGTHTLRVFAARPWHESFKNAGAYAQSTFHVLTKTAENNPDPQQPLLTYSRPAGTYGAEPIMLDYYLTNAPSHPIANASTDRIPDWRIRATVNDQQFIIDRWTPIYLKGFKPGKNWVRLELLDDRGNPMPNVYNDTTSLITYDPQNRDALAQLIRGEIDPTLARSLIDPNYIAAKPVPSPAPISEPMPVPIPVTPPPIVKQIPVPTPVVTPQPAPIPSPVVITPPPPAIPSPIVIVPAPPAAMPSPVVITPPQSAVIPTPAVVTPPQPAPIPSPVVIAPPPPTAMPTPVIVTPLQPTPIPNSTPVQIHNPEPIQLPTPTAMVQPNPVPSPQPITTIPTPTPIPVAEPSPVATPAPTVAKIPVISTPQPIAVPSPAAMPQPNHLPLEPTTSIRQAPAPVPTSPVIPASPPAQNPVPIATSTPNPQGVDREHQTWQTKAIELIQIAGVKTRAFTNTIPAKAQRFGQNVQIWAGRAIDTIQSWRNQG
jgi:hypothetical protein